MARMVKSISASMLAELVKVGLDPNDAEQMMLAEWIVGTVGATGRQMLAEFHDLGALEAETDSEYARGQKELCGYVFGFPVGDVDEVALVRVFDALGAYYATTGRYNSFSEFAEAYENSTGA